MGYVYVIYTEGPDPALDSYPGIQRKPSNNPSYKLAEKFVVDPNGHWHNEKWMKDGVYQLATTAHTRSHHTMWITAKGPIPVGCVLANLCGDKGCFNPDHWKPVTRGELARMREGAKTHCKRGHPYDNTPRRKNGTRRCAECARLQWQRTTGVRREKRIAALRARGIDAPPIITINGGRKRLGRPARTHCKHGHELTPENTTVLRGGYRDCKTCRREITRRHRLRHPPVQRPKQTHCKRGHEFTEENTHVTANGSRSCKKCAAARTARLRLNFTPEQRERTKQQYLERNREMAAQRWVEWHTSGKDDDSYIFHLMCRGMGRGEYAALQQHPDLPEIIEAWRQNLKLKRAIEQRKPK